MLKCGWTHCSCGTYITDNQKKVKVGKRWYHEECANEREVINDVITLFTEQVNANVDQVLLRKIINEIVYIDNKPAEYVMYAVKYAIDHPAMKLTFPQGLYRICNDLEVNKSWCKMAADKAIGNKKIQITEVQSPTAIEHKATKNKVSDLFD